MHHEDYGMCCGEEEAIQCIKEYNSLRDLEREKTKSKELKSITIFLGIACTVLLFIIVIKC